MKHAAFNYDTTKFQNTEYYQPMPDQAPTGFGMHHKNEHRDTVTLWGVS